MNNVSWFKFQLSKDLLTVILSWLFVVGTLYAAFQIFTTEMVALNFITFGFGTIFLCGISFPLIYMKVIKRKGIDSLGISKHRILTSIGLGILLSVIQYSQTIVKITLPEIQHLVPLITMVLAVGLFENIFFRGWMQQRFEDAFGVIPSVLLASIFYSLYHIGYGMTWSEIYVLFYIGLFFAIVFRLTQNIFILFPFLTPSGALYTNIKEGLLMPFEATYGFVIVIVLSVMTIIYFGKFNITNKLGGPKDV